MKHRITLTHMKDLSAYKIHLRITMCKFTNPEEGSDPWDTEMTYKVTWSWNQEENPDLTQMTQWFLSKLHTQFCPIAFSQVTGARCLKRCKSSWRM